MLTLYPEIAPYATHRLDVGDGHSLYLEEAGNPEGIPVLVVHGGPGAGSDPAARRFFDAERYRIILFDQRGSGRSTPFASVTNNTTSHLLADMERIRAFLGIERWLLFGGSWGATLSLLYTQSQPERVLGLVLRGIFLCRQRDINWFLHDGASRIFPDYWEDFISLVPESGRQDLVQAYHRLLHSDNELQRLQAARTWAIWEARCATLHPSPAAVERFGHAHLALSLARIECHYFLNGGFIEENRIMDNIGSMRDKPARLVHGRYDMVCPVENALTLHSAWPEAELSLVRDAGHAASEPPIVDALIHATDAMSDRFGPEFGFQ
ncbi:prolyl aminopeptidase [Halomonadaceae bacterium KBTZ08]